MSEQDETRVGEDAEAEVSCSDETQEEPLDVSGGGEVTSDDEAGSDASGQDEGAFDQSQDADNSIDPENSEVPQQEATEATEAGGEETEVLDSVNPIEAAEEAPSQPEDPQAPKSSEALTKILANKRALIIGAVVIAVAAIGIGVGVPGVKYMQADSAFQAEDYEAALTGFKEISGFLDADDRASQAMCGIHYEDGVGFFKAKKYPSAIIAFKEAGTFKDAKKRLKKAENAYTYNKAQTKLDSGDLSGAALVFLDIANYKDSKEKAASCADQLMDQEEFSNAKDIYEKLGTDYQSQCDNAADKAEKVEKFSSAKESLAASDLDSALASLNELPDDFSYHGETAASLKDRINAAKPVFDACGTFKSVDPSGCKVTERSKTSSYYQYWYTTDPLTNYTLTFKPTLNDDGSVTVNGEAKFYRYTNFSTLGSLVKGTTVSKTFSQTVTSMPDSFAFDGGTLTRNGDAWKLTWSETDQSHDIYFNYTYEANFTYTR